MTQRGRSAHLRGGRLRGATVISQAEPMILKISVSTQASHNVIYRIYFMKLSHLHNVEEFLTDYCFTLLAILLSHCIGRE